ncbi:MAG: cytochrome c biogenesis protein CcsA, partial [Candidatus Omnitrophica bacterium]|nr:cytochrome c biogenesis protein CcsA [Candidatus Omnitrophota bacterium]
TPAALQLPRQALDSIRHWAIQHRGRHKPFESFARETLQLITGNQHLPGQEPALSVLSMIVDPEPWEQANLLSVPFVPLRDALGIDRKTTHVSYSQLLSTRKLMRMLPAIVEKQNRDEKLSMLEQETMDLYERFVSLNALFERRLDLLPPAESLASSWVSITEPVGYSQEQQAGFQEGWAAFVTAVRSSQQQEAIRQAQNLSQRFRMANPKAYPSQWRLSLEVAYHRLAPFVAARIFYLGAVVGLMLGILLKRNAAVRIGVTSLWIAVFLHVSGIATRVIVGGRPPVSNFYETMLWLPFVAVVLSIFLDRAQHYLKIAAAFLAALTLFLADQVPLDSSIAPVVAVLRSNLWLTIHVLTIVASYGALALASVLAHFYGFLFLKQPGHPSLSAIDSLVYRTIQVGVVLLASGVMLGAVWANASWGRYWGWDPKETWALITLLWYLAVLHGRFAGWLKGVGVVLTTIGGFFLLLMTYYGVSFYLVGLHSYAGGHAKPVPPLLIGYFVVELCFLVLLGFIAGKRRRLI